MKKQNMYKPRRRKEEYLTNKELYPALMRAKKLDKVTTELAKMFLILVDRYSEHPWFSGYSNSWKEEMKGDALLALCRGALKFDPSYAEQNGKTPNVFAYCTTITYRAFKACRDKNKKHSEAQDKIPIGLF